MTMFSLSCLDFYPGVGWVIHKFSCCLSVCVWLHVGSLDMGDQIISHFLRSARVTCEKRPTFFPLVCWKRQICMCDSNVGSVFGLSSIDSILKQMARWKVTSLYNTFMFLFSRPLWVMTPGDFGAITIDRRFQYTTIHTIALDDIAFGFGDGERDCVTCTSGITSRQIGVFETDGHSFLLYSGWSCSSDPLREDSGPQQDCKEEGGSHIRAGKEYSGWSSGRGCQNLSDGLPKQVCDIQLSIVGEGFEANPTSHESDGFHRKSDSFWQINTTSSYDSVWDYTDGCRLCHRFAT